MKATPDHNQTVQRIKVGLIGLAAVVLLIALASVVIGSASRTPVLANAGEVVTNVEIGNDMAGEPLAELGAAPGPTNDEADPTR